VDKAEVIHRVCQALARNEQGAASALAKESYPFRPAANGGRKYSAHQMTRVFLRDGFVDRYSGTRLVFPGTLRLLSQLMPEEFPAHPNWKMSDSHIVYWELFPTIDHVVPVARGGTDDDSNWVTTSMLRNAAKANWTLEELGWSLLPAGNVREWDGLMAWFVDYTRKHPKMILDRYLTRWRLAALRALGD
jgi:hypothetical protein